MLKMKEKNRIELTSIFWKYSQTENWSSNRWFDSRAMKIIKETLKYLNTLKIFFIFYRDKIEDFELYADT